MRSTPSHRFVQALRRSQESTNVQQHPGVSLVSVSTPGKSALVPLEHRRGCILTVIESYSGNSVSFVCISRGFLVIFSSRVDVSL